MADVFWARFQTLFPSKRVTPARVLALPHMTLRSIGISNSKVSFLHHLAQAVTTKSLDLPHLPDLPDAEVLSALTQIKGIGPWTAEMFLIFTLGRPDVFSPGDQGLKNAIKKLYSSPPDPTIWSPYRSFASRVLWKFLDNT